MPDWKSATVAVELKRLDRAGFAQEFLRRNHTYQDDYDRLARRGGAETTDGNVTVFPRRWGVRFPVRSTPARIPIAGPVVSRASA